MITKFLQRLSSKVSSTLTGTRRVARLGVIITNTDAHQSEYIADADRRVEFMSGFSGSNALCIVSTAMPSSNSTHASSTSSTNSTTIPSLLFTDGRYYEQARKELTPAGSWNLMKLEAQEITPSEYIANELLSNVSGYFETDPRYLSISTYQEWQQKYFDQSQSKSQQDTSITNQNPKDAKPASEILHLQSQFPLVFREDVVDAFWDEEQPNRKKKSISDVFIHDIKYAGCAAEEKIGKVQKLLSGSADVGALVVTALDEIAWILNLRGKGDIPYCPVFFSYLVIPVTGKPRLYCNLNRDDKNLIGYIENQVNVELRRYESFDSDIKGIVESLPVRNVWIDPQTTNMAVYNALLQCTSSIPKLKTSPIAKMKSIKNSSELEGMVEAQFNDTLALACYFSWLEDQIAKGWVEFNGIAPNEFQVAEKLEYFRSQLPDFHGPSFATISSIGNNGAIIHYHPDQKNSERMDAGSVYLCDSGGQYSAGTTDVTRTLHIGAGKPTEHERRCYTRVLQGHINLSLAVFPEQLSPHSLDILARSSLWQDGLNYLHGTGHGVGAFGLVHEYPPLIPSRPPADSSSTKAMALEPGMIVTNEPGYYEFHSESSENGASASKRTKNGDDQGGFGIRLENMMIVEECKTLHNFNNKKYYRFKTITLCPYQRKMIDMELLSSEQKKWLNEYNNEVRETVQKLIRDRRVGSLSNGDITRAVAWVEKETASL